MGPHTLLSQSYEDGIYKDYGAGINTLDEKFTIPIGAADIPKGGWNGVENKVKFRLRFKNPNEDFAKDVYTTTNDYVLEYPSNKYEWIVFVGSEQVMTPASSYGGNNETPAFTGVGQFSFFPEGHSRPRGSIRGQTFESTGKLKTSGGGEDPGYGGGRSN